METMRIIANYNDNSAHFNGNPKDYPIANAGADNSRSAIFARVDLRVIAKRGVGNTVTNTVWLQTVNPVKTPTFEDYAFMTLTHWNDSDNLMKKWEVGSIIPKGELICGEGTDGVTENQIQIACGRGYSDNWTQNTTNAWVMTGDTKKPEEVFYVDPSFTTIVDAKGISFQSLPIHYGTPIGRNTKLRQVNVMTNVQEAYSNTSGNMIGMVNPGIYNLLQVSGEFAQIESGLWVKLISGKVVILEAEVVPSTLNSIADTSIGSNVNIVINKRTSNVSHTLRYIFNSTAATIATNVDSSYQFNLSKDLYYHMVDSKFTNMTIYCDTYSNGNLIRTTSTTFKVSAVDSDVKPTVSITTSVDDKTKELTNDEDTIIVGVTDLTYQLTSEPKYDANIVSYQIEDATGIKNVSANGILENLNLTSALKYRVVDSRGYDDWYSKNFNIISYTPIALSYRAVRENENNLEEVTINYSGVFDNKVFGSKEGALTNQLGLELYYRKADENDWTEVSTLNPEIEGNKYEGKFLLPINFDKNAVYYFKLIAKDLITEVEIEKVLMDQNGQFFDFLFPVGSGFIDFTNIDYTNYLGFIWEKTLLGKTPVGCDISQTEFNILGKIGGSKNLLAHNHSFTGGTSQNGNHYHTTMGVEASSLTNPSKTVLRPAGWDGQTSVVEGNAAGDHVHSYSGTTSTTGEGNGQNLPPYEVVNFWKRIA